jgi:hypothetical protein
VTLANAGASANPFVIGFYDFFQVCVGHDTRGKESSHACNLRCDAMRHNTPCGIWRPNEGKGSLCDAARPAQDK